MARTDVPVALSANPLTSKAAQVGMYAWNPTPDFLGTRRKPRQDGSADKLAHWAARDAGRRSSGRIRGSAIRPRDLAGKTVVTNAISDERLADLGSRGVDLVASTRRPSRSTSSSSPRCSGDGRRPCRGQKVTTNDLMEFIESAQLEAPAAATQW